MTIHEIANRLVELCRKGDFETAQKELFATDALSIEPVSTPEFPKETKGLAAILDKGKKFDFMVEATHSINISEPLIAVESFSTLLHMDVTMKKNGKMLLAEICLYKVKDGKIISEEFFM